MKKFYNREREMNQLHGMQQQAFSDCSRFVVLTGRRRVGKTSLVYRLMETTVTCFAVWRCREADCRWRICNRLNDLLGRHCIIRQRSPS